MINDNEKLIARYPFLRLAYIDGVTSLAMELLVEVEKYNNDASTAREY